MTDIMVQDSRSLKDTSFTGVLSLVQTAMNYFFVITGVLVALVLVLSLVVLVVLLLIS
jgi:hypothetical protein